MSLRRRVMGASAPGGGLGVYEFDVEFSSVTSWDSYIQGTLIPSLFDGLWLSAAIFSVENINTSEKYSSNFVARINPSLLNPIKPEILPLTLSLNGKENTFTSIPNHLMWYSTANNVDGVQYTPRSVGNTYNILPGRYKLVIYGFKN